MVQDAKKIQAEAPEMFKQIKAGVITTSQAKREIRHEKAREDSRQAVKAVAAIAPKKFCGEKFGADSRKDPPARSWTDPPPVTRPRRNLLRQVQCESQNYHDRKLQAPRHPDSDPTRRQFLSF